MIPPPTKWSRQSPNNDHRRQSEDFWDAIRDEQDILFVCSFPRSGSRWLRHLFYFAALQRADETSLELYAPVHRKADEVEHMPYRERYVLNADRCPALFRSLRPDLLPCPIYRSHNLEQIAARQNQKLLYIYREPAALMNSYFHYVRARKNKRYCRSLKAFCKRMMPEWIEHIQSAIEFKRSQADRICVLKYQDDFPLRPQSAVRASQFLGLPFSEEEIAAAFQKLESHLAELNASPESPHPRGRNIGMDKDYDEAQLSRIREQSQPLLDALEEFTEG